MACASRFFDWHGNIICQELINLMRPLGIAFGLMSVNEATPMIAYKQFNWYKLLNLDRCSSLRAHIFLASFSVKYVWQWRSAAKVPDSYVISDSGWTRRVRSVNIVLWDTFSSRRRRQLMALKIVPGKRLTRQTKGPQKAPDHGDSEKWRDWSVFSIR